MQTPPGPLGLYDPRFEHDSCGVSFVANIKGVRSHELVHTGLVALTNLEHRGATGAEPDTGDGAGILTQVPDRFLREVMRDEVGVELPPAGAYAVGMAFLPAAVVAAEKAQAAIETIVADEGLTLVAWRDVPVDPSTLGATARAAMPSFKHLVISDPGGATGVDLDRKAFLARKRIEHELDAEFATYFPSLSSRTLVYKGMLTTPQLSAFFPDLTDERYESALLLVHSRFSTNTFPSWPLAHPYRYVAHNGEINTVQGNQNWMRAREAMLDGSVLPGIERAFPICTPGASDTARFDEVLELLHLGGRPLHHAVLMMIPEAWENNAEMDAGQRAFYRFHSTVMEPWDGPASVTFTDGTVIGAVLDRNGLRPSRYWVTDDDLVVMASEVGVIDIDPAKVVTKGRLQPGRMFLIDTAQGRIVDDEEIKTTLAAEHPYAEWLERGPRRAGRPARAGPRRVQPRQRAAPPAAVRLHPRGAQGHPRPDGAEGHRAARLDGHRHADRRAVVAAPAAVRLLLPALRPGHQPAAGRHPRGGRHVGLVDDRAGGQPARPGPGQLPPAGPAVPDHRQRRAVQDRPRQRRREVPGPAVLRRQGPLPRQRRRAGARARPGGHLRRGHRGHRGRRPRHRAVGPQRRRGRGADPVAAADRGRAPPPRAHQAAHDGRPPRRVRRRPRGAPHGAPHRLRRRRHQPVPGLRVDRGPHRRGHARARAPSIRPRPCATTSRRAARACSR